MRIIAGSAGGLTLLVPDNALATRPFLEMARGALFNSLGGLVVGARALDLYAGSGALGLEALSRGAASCVFVERERRACELLARNIESCGFSGRSECRRADVAAALGNLRAQFDLIFLDPPFRDAETWGVDPASRAIIDATARLLAAEGQLVFRLEADRKAPAPEWGALALVKDKRYGRSRICRYAHPCA